MPQTYRLRLGDGTILMVDHDGLSTWETDRTAAVGTKHPNKWIPLKEFLVQERAEAFRRAREEPPESPAADTPITTREDGLPLVPPPAPLEAASDGPDPASAPEEETPLPSLRDDVASLELPPPTEEPTPDVDLGVSAVLSEPVEPAPAAVIEEAVGPASPPSAAARPVPIAEEIDLEPLAAAAMTASPVAASPAPAEELPVIPLRPQEDETPPPLAAPNDPGAASEAPALPVQTLADDLASAPSAWGRRARASEEPPEPAAPVRLPVVVRAILQWTGLLGVVLSRCLAPINRLDQGLPLFGFDVPGAPLGSHVSPGGEISLPTFELDFEAVRSRASSALHLDALRVRASKALRELPSRTRGWLDGLTSRVVGLTARGAHPQATLPAEEPAALPLPVLQPLAEPSAPCPAAPPPASVFTEEPAVPVPVPQSSAVSSEEPTAPPPAVAPRPRVRQPPPAATELPALHLAPISDARSVGDVYSGHEGGSIGSSMRLWTRRLFLSAALLAGAALAGLHWDSWSPAAGNMGGTIFSEIDGRVRWWHLARERQAVIDQASEQFPHLARDTVGLILSTNRTHILEPPAVFETAWGAAERGASTLTATEVEELEGLRQELLDELPPLDQERLRTFDRAHAQGAVFPFDARRGLLAFARGARALPPERRARLQMLLGKAIAAGLAS